MSADTTIAFGASIWVGAWQTQGLRPSVDHVVAPTRSSRGQALARRRIRCRPSVGALDRASKAVSSASNPGEDPNRIIDIKDSTSDAVDDGPATNLGSTATFTTKGDAPIEYGEWTFKGFRSCYAHCHSQDHFDGRDVVLVHGFGANCRHWRYNIQPLAKQGWRVFAIDLLGFGMGDKPAPGELDADGGIVEYTFDYWAAQLEQFCETIVRAPRRARGEREVPPVLFVANSIGSMVTMQASINNPSLCCGHVFISPSLRQLNVRKRSWLQAITAPLATRVLSYKPLGAFFLQSLARPDQLRSVLLKAYAVKGAVDEELVDILRAPALSPGALDVFLAFIMYDSGPIPEMLLPEVSCPSLMLWGELDSFEPYRDGLALRHYATVRRFETLHGVGHCGHDEVPDVVNDHIITFAGQI